MSDVERWRDDGWGLRIRQGTLEGQRKRLVAYVDVLQRCEANDIHLRMTGEIAPLNPKISGAFLGAVDCLALLPDLLTLANEVRDHLLTGKGPDAETVASHRRPTLVQMSTVDPEDVDFLWYPYLPLGKLTILEGDPGVGKTFLALAIASTISTGGVFLAQDGAFSERVNAGNVVYMSAEDGLGDTLRKRLDSAGADVSRVYALTGWASDENDETGFATMQDLDVLKDAMEQARPQLVVIDPLQAYLGPGVNMSRAEETRPVLEGIANLAKDYQCAIVIIRHLSKATQPNELYRGMGSIDFTAAVRSVIAVGFDPDDKTKHVMVHPKHNLTPEGVSIAYTIADGRFAWVGKTEHTPRDILIPIRENEGDKSKLDEAKTFLMDALSNGTWAAVAEIDKTAKGEGISQKTLRRAKESLKDKIETQKMSGVWMMRIPTFDKNSDLAHQSDLEKNNRAQMDGQDGQDGQVIENKGETEEFHLAHMGKMDFRHNSHINQQVIDLAHLAHPHETHGQNENLELGQDEFEKLSASDSIPIFDDEVSLLFEAPDKCPECDGQMFRRRGGMECGVCGHRW